MSRPDPAMESLVQQLISCKKERPIWLADEHPIDSGLLEHAQMAKPLFVSNRYDQCSKAKHAGLEVIFSDFELDNDITANNVFIRTPKERPVVHHQINTAFKMLPIGGKLWLFGHKAEGIKSHIDKAATLFGSRADISKGKNQLFCACMTKSAEQGNLLPDQDYSLLRQVNMADGQAYWSKPGLYGWDKIDQGSGLLVSTLSREFDNQGFNSILDIGCGYGYLSLYAKELTPKKLVATDNCFAAIEATRKNLGDTVEIEVLPSDAAGEIRGQFDLILCNPPFHQGFTVSEDLHPKFLSNTRRLLKPDGQAWYVVNQFVPLEKYCDQQKLSWTEITRDKGFKIFKITLP